MLNATYWCSDAEEEMKNKLRLTKEERAALSGIMRKVGALGGLAKSEAKRQASAENGQLGGRPRDAKPSELAALQRESRERRASGKRLRPYVPRRKKDETEEDFKKRARRLLADHSEDVGEE